MVSNLDRYKKDLESLIIKGGHLSLAMERESSPAEFDKAIKKAYKEKADENLKLLPSFKDSYQVWYSESTGLVKQPLPGRLSDFSGHYGKPKSRNRISYQTCRLHDYLQ